MIHLARFGGARPVTGPTLLESHEAVAANAALFHGGELTPEVMPRPEGTVLSKAGTVVTLYPLFNAGFPKWLHWTSVVDVVPSPTAGNTDQRIIFTGDGAPKITNYTLATTGIGTDYPLDSYTLGIPTPAAAATLTVSGGAVPLETRSYVYTFVSAWDEEGPPSDPLTATGNISGTWNFNGMATVVAGDYNVTKKRIYRTVTGTNGAVSYLFVAEVTLATANYADTIATSALGEELPSSGWVAPDSTMHSIVEMPGGILAGAVLNEVCFCIPYQPHAWPQTYRISVGSEIIGLAVFGSNLVVCTKGKPVVITGSDPEQMGITYGDSIEPCVQKRGIVSFGDGVAYPSPNGLIMVRTSGTMNVTEKVFHRDQWQTLIGFSTFGTDPTAGFIAARYAGKYIFCSPLGGAAVSQFAIIDFTEDPAHFYYGTFAQTTPASRDAKGFYVNTRQEEQLYYVDDVKQVMVYGFSINSTGQDFRSNASAMNYSFFTWKSKWFRFPKPLSMRYVRVDADFGAAHPSYLTMDELLKENSLLPPLRGQYGIAGGRGIASNGIALGGLAAPYHRSPQLIGASFTPTIDFDQGVLYVQIYAGNSAGPHQSSPSEISELTLIDSFNITGPHVHTFGNEGQFDMWQVRVGGTVKVRKVQVAPTTDELRSD